MFADAEGVGFNSGRVHRIVAVRFPALVGESYAFKTIFRCIANPSFSTNAQEHPPPSPVPPIPRSPLPPASTTSISNRHPSCLQTQTTPVSSRGETL